METVPYRVEQAEHRLDAQSAEIERIALCLERLTALEERQQATQDDHEARLREVEQRRGAMWDKVVYAALGALASGVVVYAMSGIGIN